jgi:L-2-hydroxyglutarate oxidase LhgO
MKKYDVIIIGGGLYGSLLALHLKKRYSQVLLIEKEAQLLTKASYYNQARVHNGYHYPRSFITAIRSHQNFVKFCKEFKSSIVKKFPSFYAIAKHNSKVNAIQFERFCHLINTPIKKAPEFIKEMFNQALIEEVFQVEEFEFDAAILRHDLHHKIMKKQIEIWFNSQVMKVKSTADKNITVSLQNGKNIVGTKVLNCTYAGINTILQQSDLPLISVKFEYTEMPLVKLPLPYKKKAHP